MQITKIKTPFLGTTIYTDISNLFFRFWSYHTIGKISSNVMYIQGSPHYYLARKSLEIFEESPPITKVKDTEEYKSYEKYTVHEGKSFGRKVHSAEIYLNNIFKFYSTNFNLEGHTVQTVAFGKTSNDKILYYISDGAHRIAYLAALNNIRNSSMRAKITIIGQAKNFPDVKSVIFSDKTITLQD